jgi:hypothetical protein
MRPAIEIRGVEKSFGAVRAPCLGYFPPPPHYGRVSERGSASRKECPERAPIAALDLRHDVVGGRRGEFDRIVDDRPQIFDPGSESEPRAEKHGPWQSLRITYLLELY